MRLSIEERGALQQTARSMLASRYPIARVRELLDHDRGFDGAIGAEFTAMGWAPMAIPEHLGGYGVHFGDASVIVAELGRALVGGPHVASLVVAAGALAMASNTSLAAAIVPSLLDGSMVASVAIAGADGHYSVAGLGVGAHSSGSRFVLAGEAAFVLEGQFADRFIVFARAPHGVVAVVVDRKAKGVTVTATSLVDQTRRFASVRFDGVPVGADALLDEVSAGASLLDRVVELGALCTALDSFGVAEIVLERTSEYAKQRFQFGRSIGSFQAIKHRLADAVLLVETSRVVIDHAAESIDFATRGSIDSTIRIANAKSYVGEAAAKICGDAVQIHGGIGFTWEHDTHLYVKRAIVNQSFFGQTAWHLGRLANAVLPTTQAL